MKKALLAVICMMMFIWIVPSISVQAAEGYEYEYSGFFNYNPGGNVYSDVENFTIRTHYPIYGYLDTISNTDYLIYACVVPEGDYANDIELESSRVVNDGNMSFNPKVKVTFLESDFWLYRLKTDTAGMFIGSHFSYFRDYNVTFPVFGSKKALIDFLETGDESGWINKSDVDYSVKHDFSKDVYDPNIPVPELSNLSYHGFSVSNIDGYYLDLIVDYSLLGVKIVHAGLGSYMPVEDEDWKYTSHYYNFTLDNRAISQDVVDINNIYGVDIEHDLIEDFKQWSLDYPKYQALPSYSFFKSGSGINTAYNMIHVYSASSSFSDLKQLRDSQQGLVSYYVRFYDIDGNCGQWMRYTYNSNYEIYSDVVTIGSVKSDSQGNPVVDNEIKGSQDKESGELTYNSNYVGIDISDVNSYFSYIRMIFNNISSSLDSFGSLVTACFGFLPQEVVGLIIFGIVLMVFVGIVKAVIS